MPDLRDGARAEGRAADGRARPWRAPRACRFHAQAVGRGAAIARATRHGHGRACLRHRCPAVPGVARAAMAEARDRDPGGALVRVAVLRARLCIDPLGLAQHVHPDRARHGRCVPLQRGRGGGAGPVPRRDEGPTRPRAGLFRGGRGHRRARAARPGARAPRTRADRRRDPRTARPRAQDRAPPALRRQDRDRTAGRSQGRRHLARAAWRQDPNRRHGDRGFGRGR